MPRQARIDLRGHLYHVIGRGIEQRDIFVDPQDFVDFLTRLEKVLGESGSKCFAFSLLPNHFHLLILRGHRPLSELMRRLMTGYAVRFNRKHKRVGHLFQNRYKAVLCDKDSYLLELVAYIHLNPLRAGLVGDLTELQEYKWCGHGTLLRRNDHKFLAKDDILGEFGSCQRSAARKYGAFIAERAGRFEPGELSGGGAVRNVRGDALEVGEDFRTQKEKPASDERILGEGDFVKGVLRKSNDSQGSKLSISEIIKQVERDSGVAFEEIRSRGQARQTVKARAMYCYLAKEWCGLSGAQLMKQLRLSSGAISHLTRRGTNFLNAEL
jgi:putative transposase